MNQATPSYLMAGQSSELERLQLQSRVWEPAGRDLLARLPPGSGWKALDVGCGVMGWLRVLSEWVGGGGAVIGSDTDDRMLANAGAFIESESLSNVTLIKDDLFASKLPDQSFDLVHSRFQIAPLGRAAEQVAAYARLVRPGGWIVLEDPDLASWRINPRAAAAERLISLIDEGFRVAGGNFNSGRELPDFLRGVGGEPRVEARIVALPPGHPYLRLPLQFAASLRPRLEAIVGQNALNDLIREVEAELERPGTWGTTFTLIQAYGSIPG